ncbi:G-protein coupled receptors family 1 profile domain-containing protein [Caenorhabditis elegans]|uniref:G-protein coupled receptors family 1 profile domain-containing protein n=1 Tax=Caenorhabditis elegans TaxID=6239 RepID=Q20152_CAEEL|nr:G-protein coupled receptors family 1 profile domain-containing protein [Caenorhabditis elegans]CAA98472.2 G-protein coupled receptors family 1 profile domain-containing protein [Caenorhabditis elegans]|eukprot:NP_505930.2 Serpentine Receptor, class X [Caenorhabditis elegans]
MASNSSNEDVPIIYNYQDPSSFIASILMIVNGSFGVVCNSLIIYIFCKETKERTAFNVICMVRAFVNLYILITNHLGLFVPMTLSGKAIVSKTLETWAISMSNSLYMANEYLTVVISVNRFISLFFPLYYVKLCGMKPTVVILIVMYAYRIGAVAKETISFTAINCYILYYVEYLSWLPDFSPQCSGNSGILLFMAVNFAIVSVINVATFAKIFKFYKNQNKTDKESRKRIKKNIYLFIQTVLQDSLYLIDISFTFYFNSFYDYRFWTFFCGTFVWQSLHSLDGFIMIMFNERLSFLKKQLFQPLASKVSFVRVSQVPSRVHSNA